MTIGILGKKLGMTQLFAEDGTVTPVTVVQAGPCRVLQVKAKEAAELAEPDRAAHTNLGKKKGKHARPRRDDGYYAVQIGFDAKDAKHTNKAEAGHVARSGGTAMRYVKELRCAELPKYKQGDDLTVALFEGIKHVDITGLTKGLGHAGTIRRFGFHRQAQSHGNSKAHRKVGGTGRTYATAKGMPKGKRMAGRKGVDRVTMQNLEVVKIDAERNLLFVKGSIPGKPSGYLIVRKAAKKA